MPAQINSHFVAYRDALRLPQALVSLSIRHSYVSHLTEDGVDRRFFHVYVCLQADSSTAIYSHLCYHFLYTSLRLALSPSLVALREGGLMSARLDYRSHLQQVISGLGMFATTDLIEPLFEQGSDCPPHRSTHLTLSAQSG